MYWKPARVLINQILCLLNKTEKLKIFIYFIFISLFLTLSITNSQEMLDENMELTFKKPTGTEFWVTFMMNFRDDPSSPKNALTLELFITGDNDANVVIECPALKFKDSIFVPGGTVKSLVLNDKIMVRSFEVIEKGLAVQIKSDNPISVYGLNRRYQTTDTYLGLPIQVLGTEYRAMCYHIAEELSPLIAVVATEDNTIVNISPKALTEKGKQKNQKYTVTLNKGDVYQIRSETRKSILKQNNIQEREVDQTGTLITANKKIAVFSGHECTYVPAGPPKIKACNHIVEQLPPVTSWGKHFYIGQLKGRSTYTFRVLAHQNNTRVFENEKLIATLKAGDFVERIYKEDLQITADKPVLVAQYSQGYENGDAIGDPMMLLISPTQQFLTQYRFATPVNGSWNHYANVVVPTRIINTLELNGKKVDPKLFKPLGLSRYSIAYIPVPFGTHYINANEPFGLYSYGFGYGEIDAYDAYGNMGGQSFLEYIQVSDTIPPTAELKILQNETNLILRDDKPDDTGLKSFIIMDSTGIEVKPITINEGVLQIPVAVVPSSPGMPGALHFVLADVANNKTQYTLCYTFNTQGGLEFMLNKGYITTCIPEPGLIVGAFGKFSTVFHESDFSKSGNITSAGKFSSAAGSGGYGGLYVGKRLLPYLNVSARLSYEKYGGELSAPDSVISHRRDTATGELLPFQETHYLTSNSTYLNFSFAAEYTLSKFLYAAAGLNFAFLIDNSVIFKKAITIPNNLVYSNNEKEFIILDNEHLTSMRTLRMGAFFGLGASVPVYRDFSAFLETSYNIYPFSILDDADWTSNYLSFIFGIKYQL